MRPRVPASQGLPLARPLLVDLPADWWVCGQNLAHDTRCAADGNRVMSTPISAISSAAATASTPGISAGRAAGSEKGVDRLLDARVEGSDLGADPIGVVEHHLQDRGGGLG